MGRKPKVTGKAKLSSKPLKVKVLDSPLIKVTHGKGRAAGASIKSGLMTINLGLSGTVNAKGRKGLARYIEPIQGKILLPEKPTDNARTNLEYKHFLSGKISYETFRSGDWPSKGNLHYVTGVKSFDFKAALKRFGYGILVDKKKGEFKTGIKNIVVSGQWYKDTDARNPIPYGSSRRTLDRRDIDPHLRKLLEDAYKREVEKNRRNYEKRRGQAFSERGKYVRMKRFNRIGYGYNPSEELKGRFSNPNYKPFAITINKKLSEIGEMLLRISNEAQQQLLRELDEVKMWKNLTGNATTGIVSRFVAMNTSGRGGVLTRNLQLPSAKHKLATRGMLSPDKANNGIYSGRRYDNWKSRFYINSESVDFMETSGRYAYTEAMKMLDAINPLKLSSSKGTVAVISVVSGAPYTPTLETSTGDDIMIYARDRLEQILMQKIHQGTSKIK